MTRPVIALDADGVLLDFHLAYAHAWRRVFGSFPAERDPLAYWPMDRWDVPRLGLIGKDALPGGVQRGFWSSVPSMPGAVQARHRLADAGYELGASRRWSSASRPPGCATCAHSGYPIERVIATGHRETACSPKAAAVESIRGAGLRRRLPALFQRRGGLDPHGAGAACERQPELRPGARLASSVHQDLAAFAESWLAR